MHNAVGVDANANRDELAVVVVVVGDA